MLGGREGVNGKQTQITYRESV